MTDFQIVPRADLDAAAWDRAVEASSGGWVWHIAAVVAALATWPRHSDRSFAVLDASGAVLAIVPLHKIADRMARVINASRLLSVGGPALIDALGERQRRGVADAIAQELDAVLSREKASWVEAVVAPLTPVVLARALSPNPLIEFGFADCSRTTWVVDLARDEAAIRAGYSQLTRRQLRKAAEEPFVLREAQGAADCDRYYRLHVETCARTLATPLPPDYMQAIFADVMPRGLARILFLERKGTIVAAQITGRWKGGALYWSGASLDERGGGDNRILFDSQIMSARESGCCWYDTGQAYPLTSDPKEKGLSDFKASFGATLARFPHGRRYVADRNGRWLAGLRVARAIARGETI